MKIRVIDQDGVELSVKEVTITAGTIIVAKLLDANLKPNEVSETIEEALEHHATLVIPKGTVELTFINAEVDTKL